MSLSINVTPSMDSSSLFTVEISELERSFNFTLGIESVIFLSTGSFDQSLNFFISLFRSFNSILFRFFSNSFNLSFSKISFLDRRSSSGVKKISNLLVFFIKYSPISCLILSGLLARSSRIFILSSEMNRHGLS